MRAPGLLAPQVEARNYFWWWFGRMFVRRSRMALVPAETAVLHESDIHALKLALSRWRVSL